MLRRRLRSTRGRVAAVTLVTFMLVGSVLFTVMDRSSIIGQVQDLRESDLIDQAESRILAQQEATGTATPKEGQVRVLIVPAGSVAGLLS